VWVQANPENAAKVWRALVEFGAPLAGLVMSIDGVKFEEAWPNRVESHLGAQPAWFISREDLVKNKRTVGRHIDPHDAGLLE